MSKQVDRPDDTGKVLEDASRVRTLTREGIQALQLRLQSTLFQHQKQIRIKNLQIETEHRRYTNLFNLAPVGFLSLDKNNNIIDANIASARLFTTPRRNLIGSNFQRFICPSCQEPFSEHRKRARLHQHDNLELELFTALGSRFTASLDTLLTRELNLLVAFTDISARKAAEQELINARSELQTLCMELRKERDQRIRAEEELRKFGQKLLETQERERQRISRELHDHVGQLMTYLVLLLDKVKSRLDPDMYRDAKSAAHEVLTQIRDLSSDLQPTMLQSVGLVPALQALFDRIRAVAGIHIEFRFDQECSGLGGDLSLTAYRIVQEAITNVVRHAEVDKVLVSLTDSEGRIRIAVEDCGKGFNISSQIDCVGLTGMKERAQLIGGSLSVFSMPGHGTNVIAELPLPVSADARKKAND